MKRAYLIPLLILGYSIAAFGQVAAPRESQRQEITQNVGDTKITIVYSRPNTKSRKLWGCDAKNMIPIANYEEPCIVPNGQVWRAGANENTTMEFSRDVTINGQALPAGKYGFHIIPGKTDWTLIFSKDNDKWGSFTYDEKKDALRVKVKPEKAEMHETLTYDFEDVTARTAKIALRWEKISVPFTADIGDIYGRVLTQFRDAITNRKADDYRPYNAAANYVRTFKLKANYDEALGWVDTSIKAKETPGNLNVKAGLLAEMGRFDEAAALGEKALALAKSSTPPASASLIETLEISIKNWKAKKVS